MAASAGGLGLLLCFALLALASSAPTLRGVSPRDEKYFARPVIACRDGSRTFTKDRLNDGFCDCPDGTDEPGTSACPESKFYCRNVGDKPRFLFSSRVNDYICDCCDGSDEYDSGVHCRNTCHKDHNVSEDSTDGLHEKMNSSVDTNAQNRKTRIDLEDLIQKLTGLRALIAIQLLFAMLIIVFCLYYRHNRFRRKRYYLK